MFARKSKHIRTQSAVKWVTRNEKKCSSLRFPVLLVIPFFLLDHLNGDFLYQRWRENVKERMNLVEKQSTELPRAGAT
jgi:hypothetical protein